MEPPKPPPRLSKRNSHPMTPDGSDRSQKEEEESVSPAPSHQGQGSMIEVSAEIHNSKTVINSDDVQPEERKSFEKRKKKVKRRGTFTKKNKQKSSEKVTSESVESIQSLEVSKSKRGSLTETISDDDSGKIKLIPLRPNVRRAPTGSATETLSEDTDHDKNEIQPPKPPATPKQFLLLPPVPARRKSVPLPITQIKTTEEERPKSAMYLQRNDDVKITLTPPIPAPRSNLSINKSIEPIGSAYCTSSSMDYQDCEVLPNRQKKTKKKRKLKDGKEPSETSKTSIKAANSSIESLDKLPSEEKSPVKEVEKDKEDMACITVHNCEQLQLKHFDSQLVVRLHVMDLKTNKPRKSALDKMDIKSTSTSSFEFRDPSIMKPTWEEDLFLLEPLSHIASSESLLILEVVDIQNDEILAWAFLKPVAANGALNIGKTLRLQLYKPGKSTKDTSIPKGFYWWSRGKHHNYKSTIYITLNGVPSDLIVNTTRKETVDSKSNDGTISKDVQHIDLPSNDKVEDEVDEVIWSRLPSLMCKLPNIFLASLDTANSGCMAVAYSNSGLYLAGQVGDNVCIFNYKGRLIHTFNGHQGLVYCLQWTKEDKYLISSSADTTVCVWDFANRKSMPIQVLPHPSYVYSCCWLDDTAGLIVTACYDKFIRLWNLGSKSPIQHLSKHDGPINTLAVINHERLVSGDNLGIIVLWELTSEGNLKLEREYVLREIKGKSINKILIHSGQKKMLVHTRDSVLRMVDIASGNVVQWFRGGFNNKLRCDSCFCGCGSRIFATCEDGSTCCWDAFTGQMIALYTGLQAKKGVASIDFHPKDHYLAITSRSSQGVASLNILKFDRELDGSDVGLAYIDNPILELDTSSNSLSSSISGSRSNHSHLKDTSCSSPTSPAKEKRRNKNHRKKESGFFKSILSKKKTKKGETNVGYQTTEIETNVNPLIKVTSAIDKEIDPSTTTRYLHNLHDPRDHRLTDIIKRMDKILNTISLNRPI